MPSLVTTPSLSTRRRIWLARRSGTSLLARSASLLSVSIRRVASRVATRVPRVGFLPTSSSKARLFTPQMIEGSMASTRSPQGRGAKPVAPTSVPPSTTEIVRSCSGWSLSSQTWARPFNRRSSLSVCSSGATRTSSRASRRVKAERRARVPISSAGTASRMSTIASSRSLLPTRPASGMARTARTLMRGPCRAVLNEFSWRVVSLQHQGPPLFVRGDRLHGDEDRLEAKESELHPDVLGLAAPVQKELLGAAYLLPPGVTDCIPLVFLEGPGLASGFLSTRLRVRCAHDLVPFSCASWG